MRSPSHTNPVHHIELWTHDLAEVFDAFEWLLPELGWESDHDPGWTSGRVWTHETGAYIVLEQSSAISVPELDRMRPGLNHLALCVENRDELDRLRAEAATHGWDELFADDYPHASGAEHTALFLENAQGFEVELVVPTRPVIA